MTEGDRHWLMLIMSLTGRAGTQRMRIWRSLRHLGAAVLRDGVYLLPATDAHHQALRQQAEQVESAGGRALVVDIVNSAIASTEDLTGLFDREEDYAALREALASWHQRLADASPREAHRGLLQLQRRFQAIVDVDFFPGEGMQHMANALADAEAAYNRRFVPDEPHAIQQGIHTRCRQDYQGKVWATRRRLWVDRVASAWLIQRFIDSDARFLWLASPGDCPEDALGFDFDGATFTHVGEKVTFEVLLHSFGLTEDPALARLGTLVHYLDVGGAPVPEAAGLRSMLQGARERLPDDDALLAHAGPLLDDLYLSFQTD